MAADEVEGPDDVDAVAAGLAGWLHLTTGGCRHVGDVDDGFICVPATSTE